MEFAETGLDAESPFREEGQRFAIHCGLENSPGIPRTAMGVKALNEMGTDTLQEKIHQGYIGDFPLNHEPVAMGENRREQDAIQIARVIGNDHRGLGRKIFQPLHRRSRAGQKENNVGP